MSAFISVLNIHVHMNIVLVLCKENILLFCYYYYDYYYFINYLLDACVLIYSVYYKELYMYESISCEKFQTVLISKASVNKIPKIVNPH